MPWCLVQHTHSTKAFKECNYADFHRHGRRQSHAGDTPLRMPRVCAVTSASLAMNSAIAKELGSPSVIRLFKACLSFPEQKLWVRLTRIRALQQRGRRGLCIQQCHLLSLSRTLKALWSTTLLLSRRTMSGSYEGLYIFIISHKGSLAINAQSVAYCRDSWTRRYCHPEWGLVSY